MLPDKSDHVAISKWAMYIIATMIAFCLLLVIAIEKTIDTLPFGVYGLVGALAFMVAALSMAFYVKRQHH